MAHVSEKVEDWKAITPAALGLPAYYGKECCNSSTKPKSDSC